MRSRTLMASLSGRFETRAKLVLVAYPIVFAVGLLTMLYVGATTPDRSFWSAGLVAGTIVVALSLLAILVYPAIVLDAAAVNRRSPWPVNPRRYVGIGVGGSLVVGLVTEVGSLLGGGGLAPIGFMGVVAAVGVHPLVVCGLDLRYLQRRRRGSSGGA